MHGAKKVAQEIKQSFTDTETVSAQNKQIVFNIREKTNDDVIKKANPPIVEP